MEIFGVFIPNWLKLVVLIGIAIVGVIWAYKNDYLSWYVLRDMLSLDGVKDSLMVIVREPTFIFIYLVFVFTPLWVLTDALDLYSIPIWQRIILSIGGIFGVNYIMIVRGLK